MTSAASLISTEYRLGAHNYKPLDVVIERGEDIWVWDVAGKRYLDCLSAYSAVNQGHCHPKIYAAMIAQARKLTITSRAFHNDQLPLLYEDLAALTGAHKILPMNSGAEAVESAIKAVRKWGYEVKGVAADQAEIIVCANNFHGRTIAIVGFSTDPGARTGFGPFAPGFRTVRFGEIEDFERAITPRTVAFLVEPIQGEAGVIIPPAGYFAKVRELCNARQVTLILDEIQTGLGRTGKLLAEQHEFRSVGRAATRTTRLDVWRQSAGLCHRQDRAASLGRGGHDRKLRRARCLSQGRARTSGKPRRQGSPWARSDGGDRIGSRSRWRAQLLRTFARAWRAVQGHA
jgi:ornithine--oxo-acid transaminase